MQVFVHVRPKLCIIVCFTATAALTLFRSCWRPLHLQVPLALLLMLVNQLLTMWVWTLLWLIHSTRVQVLSKVPYLSITLVFPFPLNLLTTKIAKPLLTKWHTISKDRWETVTPMQLDISWLPHLHSSQHHNLLLGVENDKLRKFFSFESLYNAATGSLKCQNVCSRGLRIRNLET